MLLTQDLWSAVWPYLGNLHQALPDHAGLCATHLIAASILSGMIVGLERERKEKPAGLRTLALISTGSTIFTLASIYAGDGLHADSSRIAAQVVTGIGFLGAGAIIRDRGRIIGLTTGATIWTVAAIGVFIGIGYAGPGIVLAVVVVTLLTLTKRLERALLDPCHWRNCRLVFDADHGKTKVRIRGVLDAFKVPGNTWSFTRDGDREAIDIRYCVAHRSHRAFLAKLVSMERVHEVREE